EQRRRELKRESDQPDVEVVEPERILQQRIGRWDQRLNNVVEHVRHADRRQHLERRLLDRRGRLRRLAGKDGCGGTAHAIALIVEGGGPKNGRRRVFNLTARKTGRLCEGFAAAGKAKVDFGNPRLASYRL